MTSAAPSATRPAASGERFHVEALDGLRGIAALSVMFYHAWVFNAQGWMAVDFFYCLSGFVIAMAYEGKLRSGLPFLRYVSWRLMRVYPMLAVGGVIGLLAWRTGEAIPFLSAASPTTFTLAWLAHMLLIPFYGQEKAFPFNNVQWSILYELLANALHALFLPVLTNRVLMGVLAVSGAVLAWRTFALGTMNWGFDLRHIDVGLARMGYSFFAGVLLYRLRTAILPRLPRVPFWLLAAAIFVLTSLRFPVLRRLWWLAGPLFGLGIWVVMHYIVVPYSHAGQPIPHWPLKTRGTEELVGHLFLVGLPIAGWARRLLGR